MSAILTSDDGAVRILKLNRPKVRNALDRELRAELGRTLALAERDPGVRAVVITGSGSAFCAGMDLGELEGVLDLSAEEHLQDSHELASLFLAIYSFPKPVIAAVNGHAVAGGAGLALVCDAVVMSEDARIGFSEARIGFVAAVVGVFLNRLVGERSARELLLEAKLIGAEEALAHRLVSESLPGKQVLARALERARLMAGNSPMAVAATKRLLVESSGLPLPAALELAAKVNAQAREGSDLREGIRAFLEKRPASWSTPHKS